MVFKDCQTWLMTSDVDQWLDALERIRQLTSTTWCLAREVTDLSYWRCSGRSSWKAAVAAAVAKGEPGGDDRAGPLGTATQ